MLASLSARRACEVRSCSGLGDDRGRAVWKRNFLTLETGALRWQGSRSASARCSGVHLEPLYGEVGGCAFRTLWRTSRFGVTADAAYDDAGSTGRSGRQMRFRATTLAYVVSWGGAQALITTGNDKAVELAVAPERTQRRQSVSFRAVACAR